MKLNGLALTTPKNLFGLPYWTAVWTTAAGNAIHDRLPNYLETEPDAWAYALDHPPTWETK